MNNTTKTQFPTNMNQLVDVLDLYLVKKAPAIPPGIKEAIVKYGPWIVLVLLVLAAPALLALVGLGSLLMPVSFLGGVQEGASFSIGIIVTLIAVILEIIALPGLFKRAKSGWNFMFYSTLVSAVGSLLSLNLVGLILGTLISLYILFQVREYYK